MKPNALLALVLSGCFATPIDPPATTTTETPPAIVPEEASGGASSASASPDNTFDHMNFATDPFATLERLQVEGPPEIATRMHSCAKIMYATFGNVLRQFGVANTTGTGGTLPAAGPLYRNAASALGAPAANFATLLPESTMLTAASSVKLMDIGLQGAAEMLNASRATTRIPAFRYAGTDHGLVDKDPSNPGDVSLWRCNQYGISAILGMPATQVHMDLCNAALQDYSNDLLGANGVTNGLRANEVLAVAQIFNAATGCE